MLRKNLILTICFVLFGGGALIAQDFDYIGATKCKMCHNKEPKGQQYNVWQKGPHANAMKSLSNEKSLAYAKENGIADPTKDPGCIKCHSTVGGTNKDLHAGIKITEGVSCESCHGPGGSYKTPSIMKDQAKSLEKGLILPTEKVCITCHNDKNPFHKPFVYKDAVAKIAHPNPEK
ncbi:cytochrome c family protein, partial [Bacteroidota bacterium]